MADNVKPIQPGAPAEAGTYRAIAMPQELAGQIMDFLRDVPAPQKATLTLTNAIQQCQLVDVKISSTPS